MPIFLQTHITEESSGILGVHFWMTDSTEKHCSRCKGVCVCRLDLEYFVRIWSTWTDNVNLTIIRKYSGNGCACASSWYQAAFSPHTWPGNEANIVCAMVRKGCRGCHSYRLYSHSCDHSQSTLNRQATRMGVVNTQLSSHQNGCSQWSTDAVNGQSASKMDQRSGPSVERTQITVVQFAPDQNRLQQYIMWVGLHITRSDKETLSLIKSEKWRLSPENGTTSWNVGCWSDVWGVLLDQCAACIWAVCYAPARLLQLAWHTVLLVCCACVQMCVLLVSHPVTWGCVMRTHILMTVTCTQLLHLHSLRRGQQRHKPPVATSTVLLGRKQGGG